MTREELLRQIKTLRVDQGLRVKVVARRLGLSERTVYRLTKESKCKTTAN